MLDGRAELTIPIKESSCQRQELSLKFISKRSIGKTEGCVCHRKHCYQQGIYQRCQPDMTGQLVQFQAEICCDTQDRQEGDHQYWYQRTSAREQCSLTQGDVPECEITEQEGRKGDQQEQCRSQSIEQHCHPGLFAFAPVGEGVAADQDAADDEVGQIEGQVLDRDDDLVGAEDPQVKRPDAKVHLVYIIDEE